MTQPSLRQITALLARTPALLNAQLRDLPEVWTLQNEGEDTFRPIDVVAHLISGEREDWIPRAKMILEFGEKKAFEPFDRWGFRRESEGKSLAQLLDEVARLRSVNLAELERLNLADSDLSRRGLHPALGPVTLGQLLATWAGHDLTHLHQLSRTLAHQLREAVGPWSAYLGVLKCNGHSS